MSTEIYQAQVIRNFFDTITGTDRNLTRIYMYVISLAKLRSEEPEKLAHLIDQMKKSKVKKELSIDIIDYMCTAPPRLTLLTCRPLSASARSRIWRIHSTQ